MTNDEGTEEEKKARWSLALNAVNKLNTLVAKGSSSFTELMYYREICMLPKEERSENDLSALLSLLRGYKIPIIDSLKPEVQLKICSVLTMAQFSPGEIIFDFGETGDCMYVCYNGKVEIQVPVDPTKEELQWVPVAAITKGKEFGQLALISDNKKRSARAVASESTALFSLSADDYDDCIGTQGQSMVRHRLAFLRGIPALRTIEERDLRAFANTLAEEEIHPGRYIAKQGGDPDRIYILKTGFATVCRDLPVATHKDAPFERQREEQRKYNDILQDDWSKKRPRRRYFTRDKNRGIGGHTLSGGLDASTSVSGMSGILPSIDGGSSIRSRMTSRSLMTSPSKELERRTQLRGPAARQEYVDSLQLDSHNRLLTLLKKFPAPEEAAQKVEEKKDKKVKPKMQRVVLSTLRTGETFGLFELLEHIPLTSSLVADVSTSVYHISKYDLLRSTEKSIVRALFLDCRTLLSDDRVVRRQKQISSWLQYRRDVASQKHAVSKDAQRIGQDEVIWDTVARTPPRTPYAEQNSDEFKVALMKDNEDRYKVTVDRVVRDAAKIALEKKVLHSITAASKQNRKDEAAADLLAAAMGDGEDKPPDEAKPDVPLGVT